MTTERPILGYLVKVQKTVNSVSDINEIDLKNLTFSYYSGHDGRRMMKIPSDRTVMFASRRQAMRGKRELLRREPDLMAEVITVYEREPIVTIKRVEIKVTNKKCLPDRSQSSGKIQKLSTKRSKQKNGSRAAS